MRISLDIPDFLLRRAKSVAASRRISLCQFVAEALREKLNPIPVAVPKPWLKHVGKLKWLHKETGQINMRIQDAFESIDNE
jgi:hypothetical protein